MAVSGVLQEGMNEEELPNNHHLVPQSPCQQPGPASSPQRFGLWCSSGWSPSKWQPHSPHRRYGPWHLAWQTQSKSGQGGHLCCCHYRKKKKKEECSGICLRKWTLIESQWRNWMIQGKTVRTSFNFQNFFFKKSLIPIVGTGKGKHHSMCLAVLGFHLESFVYSCISLENTLFLWISEIHFYYK